MKRSKEFLDGYLTGFLGKAMRMSMDEPTEQALAEEAGQVAVKKLL